MREVSRFGGNNITGTDDPGDKISYLELLV